ncbi:MAG: hypothetical protein JWQ01_1607 [Massilia sp.]|nr:hypothetical protein [Massilia sp.]
MKKSVVFILSILLPVILLGACRSPDPRDLRFESIDIVKLSAIRGVWDAVQLRSDAKSDEITLLKINFSSQFDLVKLAKANTLHVSYRAFECSGGSLQGAPLFVLPDLHIKNFSIGSGVYSELSDLERFRDSNGRLTYHVFMPISSDELKRLFGNGAVPHQIPYFNPRAARADICLQLTAAAMWFGPTLNSNVVRVPEPEVSRLIN